MSESILDSFKSKEDKDIDTIKNLIERSTGSNINESSTTKEILDKIMPILQAIASFFNIILPYITNASTKASDYYRMLPMDIVYAILGLTLAFFGGTYALSLVVIETIYNSSWQTIRYNGEKLYIELKALWKRYKEENRSVVNNDGEASNVEMTKKIDFFLVNCKEPKKIMDMITSIGQTLISVLAVLSSDFAKDIALGTSIGEAFKRPANYFLVPTLAYTMPKKYHHWIYPFINYTCKTIAISLALLLGRIISTIQSGIRGGLMFSRRTLKYLTVKGYYKFDCEKSYIDEFIGWSIAAVGIYFQIRNRFVVPFPMNLVLIPLSFVEFMLGLFVGGV
jgi:hypothetical protein